MSNNDEKILKALGDLQVDIKGVKSDITTIKDVQQKQGKQFEQQGKHLQTLEAGQKTLETGQQTLDHKAEAIHAYQKQAHDEIMGTLFDSNEIVGRDQKILEKRIARIEKHLGLPPLK
jgi:hypothetical protein